MNPRKIFIKIRDGKPSEEFKTVLRSRLISYIQENPIVFSAGYKLHGDNHFSWARAIALSFASFTFVVLAGGLTAVSVSAKSIPGDLLYPVKLIAEDVRLRVSSPEESSGIRARYAEERTAEIEKVLDKPKKDLKIIEREVEQALANYESQISAALRVEDSSEKEREIIQNTLQRMLVRAEKIESEESSDMKEIAEKLKRVSLKYGNKEKREEDSLRQGKKGKEVLPDDVLPTTQNPSSNQSVQNTISLDQLFLHNKPGDCYVAYQGVVYDVSQKKEWSGCKHNGAVGGKDITSAFPHSISYLSSLPKVGVISGASVDVPLDTGPRNIFDGRREGRESEDRGDDD